MPPELAQSGERVGGRNSLLTPQWGDIPHCPAAPGDGARETKLAKAPGDFCNENKLLLLADLYPTTRQILSFKN